MRKALFLMSLVAGVAAMPLTAAAQDQNRGEQQGRHRGGGGGGGGWRGQQAQPQQAQQQPQAQPAPRGSEWVGDRNNPRMEAARQRYERLERENARNHGSPRQAREVVERQRAERANDRGNWQGDGNRSGWSGNRDGDRGGWNGNRGDRRPGWNGERGDRRPGWNGERGDNRPNWNGGRGDYRQNWGSGRDRGYNWNRNWRNDGRYDWQSYRNNNRFRFRVQPYYAPYRGWSYTRFGVGMVLDQLLFSRNYWINDPWTYRLPPAEPGLHWVRYYNDVILVDDYSGEIVDLIHDFFW